MRIFFKGITIQIFLLFYVFWRGWQLLPKNKWIRILFASIFAVEFIIYMLGFLPHQNLSVAFLHNVGWISTSWMLLIGYLSVFLLLYDLLILISRNKKRIPSAQGLTSLRVRRYYFSASLIFVLGLMTFGNYNFHHPIITQLPLTVRKHSPYVHELKIVVATDIHAGYFINKPIVQSYVNKIMEQKPDLILLVGDMIDYDLTSIKEQNMEDEFLELKAPYGVYMTTGNHEYIFDVNKTVDWFTQKTNITVLRDTAILIQESFYLVGREDEQCETRKTLPSIMQGVDSRYPIIVMNHEPHDLQQEVDAGADIAVYGHTHNGQLFPINLLLKLLYEKSYGYIQKENTHIYVSSGLGLAGPQYRIGTDSEIVVLNVKFDK